MSSLDVIEAAPPVAAADAERRRLAVSDYRMPAKVFHWVTVALVFFMVASGVTATQIGEGAFADALFRVHRTMGALTLTVVLVRLGYRLMRSLPPPPRQSRTRPLLHWALYGIILTVPLLGWAGASDYNQTDVLFGYALPHIVAPDSGYGDLLLHLHAYVAFTLLALVALHIGAAMQDYMAGEPGAAAEE